MCGTWRRGSSFSAMAGLNPRRPGSSSSAGTSGCWSATCGGTIMKTRYLAIARALASLSAIACAPKSLSPEALPLDRVECARCRMLISTESGGGEIVSATEDTRFYDDIGCLAADWAAHHGEAPGAGRIGGRRGGGGR